MPTDDTVTDTYIEMYSGARYFPNGKAHFAWNIDDIAHSLGNQCRFSGHSRHFYSVAEHSILCSLMAEETGYCDPFEALMHDAHESVLTDMSAPWKPHLPDYRAAEALAEMDLRAHYGLPPEASPGCKRIDYLVLFVEAYFLSKTQGEDWVDPLGVRPEALRLIKQQGWHLTAMEPLQAKGAFLSRFRDVETTPDRWWEHQDASVN